MSHARWIVVLSLQTTTCLSGTQVTNLQVNNLKETKKVANKYLRFTSELQLRNRSFLPTSLSHTHPHLLLLPLSPLLDWVYSPLDQTDNCGLVYSRVAHVKDSPTGNRDKVIVLKDMTLAVPPFQSPIPYSSSLTTTNVSGKSDTHTNIKQTTTPTCINEHH